MSKQASNTARTWRRPAVLAAGSLLAIAVLTGQAQGPAPQAAPVPPPPGQGGPPGGFGRGGPMEEQKLVERFDKNKDERLDSAERDAAREWLAANPRGGFGFGGRGRGGGRGFEAASPGRKLTPADVKTYGTEPLYDLKTLRTIFLQFEREDWEQELEAFNNTDVEVPATAIVDGKTYKDVGVHFRGASSFMMVPQGSKRSLNLTFDFVHENQNVLGYRTLNLLNGNSDPTFVRAVLYSEIARAYLPAPKTNFVRVVINGESWGVYANAQQYNKDFTRDYFKSDKGARWKVPGSPGGRAGMEYLGDDPGQYKRLYQIRTKDDPKDWAALIRMFKVLNETPPERLEAALSPLLDIDGVLRFLAVEMALVNTDGYWTRASDYSIYQDVKGQFHVIPHDMNEALMSEGGRGRGGRGPGGPPPDFARGGPPPGGGPVVLPAPPPDGRPAQDVFRGGPGGPGRGFFGGGGPELDPLVGMNDVSKPLRSKLLAVPALQAKYLGYVRDVAQNWLDWQKLEPRLKQYQALIDADVKADTRKLYSYEAFHNGLAGPENSLKTFVEQRRRFLLNVTTPKPEMK
jgi:hypothetical protein